MPVLRLSVLALALLAALPALAVDTPEAPSAAQATTQLPRNVRPLHYTVHVAPDAAALRFVGQARIEVEVLQPTASITLHALDMDFDAVSLSPLSGHGWSKTAKVVVDAATQTARFDFAGTLTPGHYLLAVDYRGRIGTQANGLFAVDYDTAEGRRRALYTQFENSDARRFIPSWDEPNYKAVFDLSATVPAAQMAVSNMPVQDSVELGDGRKRVRFARSPKMSTYLLFFGLGEFERASLEVDGIDVGVVTQRGKLDQAQFALDASRDVLREYHDYFGLPYPLPKLDNIGSPGRSQFFGAMENWGAIYTFEYALLVDPAISTQGDRQQVFSIAAHEIAHQWFGNLVTMRWWDDLWLNEGFATWLAARTTEKLHPEWNTALEAVDAREAAMSGDAIASTHPVVQPIETVEQASQAFDAITYEKGGAVIDMLEAYVGEQAWREGVRRYMRAHSYGNTVSDDLWREVQAAAGKPILDIAHDFTLQPGIPLITVEAARCVDGKTKLALKQGEFTKDRPGKTPLAWRVPVIAQTLGAAPASTLVEGGRGELQLEGCGPLLVNAGQSGYYRTLYTPEQFETIRTGFARLAPIDQLGLMADSWALGMAGLQPASNYLDLVAATPADASPQIWGDIAASLAGLDGYYAGMPERRALFRRFAIARLAPVLARIGWEARPDEAEPVAILREGLIGALSALGDTAVIEEARHRYRLRTQDPTALPAALRKAVQAVVARHADAATWAQLRAEAQRETTPMIKDDYYDLLASAQDPALARQALDLALTDEPGATNSAGMIATVAGLHPDLAFDFAAAHREQVDARVDSTSRSRYYPGVAMNSLDAAMIAKLDAFAEAHFAASSRRATRNAIANIVYHRQVRDTRLPAIDAWLAKQAR